MTKMEFDLTDGQIEKVNIRREWNQPWGSY